MADIKSIALPAAPPEYNETQEAINRRIIEQAIEDINVRITRMQNMKDTVLSKATKRNHFLLMGVKHG
jgi:hypothetical protein|tara:strand:- start:1751 stop:1954 length:204 start_codon:yes stop_codon:yes gene_type:complete